VRLSPASMSTPFNVQEFLMRLHNFATVDGQPMYIPEPSDVEQAMCVTRHVVALTKHLTELTDTAASFYSDRKDVFVRIMKMMSVMMLECAKRLSVVADIDAVDNRRVAVCLVLCHGCLRYAQKKLDFGDVYSFPGVLQIASRGKAGVCGGALTTKLEDLVPVIPSDADARWLARALESQLDVMDVGSIFEGCLTFAKLPEGTWLPMELEGHDYTRRVIEACVFNAGRGTVGMSLAEGYDWDRHVVVDGVRCRCVSLLCVALCLTHVACVQVVLPVDGGCKDLCNHRKNVFECYKCLKSCVICSRVGGVAGGICGGCAAAAEEERKGTAVVQSQRVRDGQAVEKCGVCGRGDVEYGDLCYTCFFSPNVRSGVRRAAAVDDEQRREEVGAAVERCKKRVRTFRLWPSRSASD
jgi:hypothetical protein